MKSSRYYPRAWVTALAITACSRGTNCSWIMSLLSWKQTSYVSALKFYCFKFVIICKFICLAYNTDFFRLFESMVQISQIVISRAYFKLIGQWSIGKSLQVFFDHFWSTRAIHCRRNHVRHRLSLLVHPEISQTVRKLVYAIIAVYCLFINIKKCFGSISSENQIRSFFVPFLNSWRFNRESN